MAPAAEQDNRVKVPDGTAAVCAEVRSFGESRSLGKPGKAEQNVGVHPHKHKSEDLRSVLSSPFCAFQKATTMEKRPWHPYDATA